MLRLVAIALACSLLATACGSGAGSPERGEPATSSGGAPRAVPSAAAPQGRSAAAVPAAAPTVAAAAAAAAAPAANDAAGRQGEATAGGSAAASTDQQSAQPTPESSTAPAQPERMIVYTTSLTVLAGTIPSAIAQVGDLATSLGGYVAGVEQHLQDQEPSAIVRLKVPAAKYDEAMNRLRSQGVAARDEQTTTQDVTEEYNDLQNQLTSLRATYNQYLELMKKATTVEDILKLQQRIDEVKLQIDRLEGRAKFLSQQSAFATITVTLRPAAQVLVKEYSAAVSQQRNLEIQQAGLLNQLKRPLPPEQEAAIRDQLNQVVLQLEQVKQQVAAIQQLAQKGSIQLPTQDLSAQALAGQNAPGGDDLAKSYLDLRVQIRAAQLRQEGLLRQINQTPPPANLADLRAQLSQTVLDLRTLNDRLGQVQEQAQREDVTLPDVDPGLLAALVGEPGSDTARGRFVQAVTQAWDASLTFLSGFGIALAQIVVFFWWLIPLVILAVFAIRRSGLRRPRLRRPAAPPPPSPQAPPAA